MKKSEASVRDGDWYSAGVPCHDHILKNISSRKKQWHLSDATVSAKGWRSLVCRLKTDQEVHMLTVENVVGMDKGALLYVFLWKALNGFLAFVLRSIACRLPARPGRLLLRDFRPSQRQRADQRDFCACGIG